MSLISLRVNELVVLAHTDVLHRDVQFRQLCKDRLGACDARTVNPRRLRLLQRQRRVEPRERVTPEVAYGAPSAAQHNSGAQWRNYSKRLTGHPLQAFSNESLKIVGRLVERFALCSLASSNSS